MTGYETREYTRFLFSYCISLSLSSTFLNRSYDEFDRKIRHQIDFQSRQERVFYKPFSYWISLSLSATFLSDDESDLKTRSRVEVQSRPKRVFFKKPFLVLDFVIVMLENSPSSFVNCTMNSVERFGTAQNFSLRQNVYFLKSHFSTNRTLVSRSAVRVSHV